MTIIALKLHATAEVDTFLYVEVTPTTVFPNQRVRVTVQGFSDTCITRISMDGIELEDSRLGGQDGDCTLVDNDGESVDGIPLDSSGRWMGDVGPAGQRLHAAGRPAEGPRSGIRTATWARRPLSFPPGQSR